MTMRFRTLLVLFVATAAGCGSGGETASPSAETIPEAISFDVRAAGPPSMWIVEPADGAAVISPFVVEVETENFVLEAAGEVPAGAGHLHVSLNGKCLSPGELIPSDDQHLHGTGGDASISISLPPGTYELCAQAGDGFHVALGVTDIITVIVEEGGDNGESLEERDDHDHHRDDDPGHEGS